MALIDLRSDTVTRPTPAMRAAMAAAAVGDDVYGEDPTTRALEDMAARLMGMEAALFVPSGTMGNQIAVACHTNPGDEVLLEASSHILQVELGMMARFSGVMPHPLVGVDGAFTARQVEEAVRPDVYYLAPTGLVCVENTHNAAGGTVWPRARVEAVVAAAHACGVPVHVDGARILNAQAATGVAARELLAGADSVMFCLSKGLGCPVGSLLCGSRRFVKSARRVRKALGGGMRQVGILAAAGLYALEHHVERLADDHVNARVLAEELGGLAGLRISPPQTNIVLLELTGDVAAADVCARLRARGVLASPAGAGADRRRIRMVTHLDVDRASVLRTADLVAQELRAPGV